MRSVVIGNRVIQGRVRQVSIAASFMVLATFLSCLLMTASSTSYAAAPPTTLPCLWDPTLDDWYCWTSLDQELQEDEVLWVHTLDGPGEHTVTLQRSVAQKFVPLFMQCEMKGAVQTIGAHLETSVGLGYQGPALGLPQIDHNWASPMAREGLDITKEGDRFRWAQKLALRQGVRYHWYGCSKLLGVD